MSAISRSVQSTPDLQNHIQTVSFDVLLNSNYPYAREQPTKRHSHSRLLNPTYTANSQRITRRYIQKYLTSAVIPTLSTASGPFTVQPAPRDAPSGVDTVPGETYRPTEIYRDLRRT